MARHSPTLVSLFAGGGGLDIGLEQVGFTTLVANELTPHACQTLRANKLLSTLERSAFDRWFEEQLRQRCYQNADKDEINRLRGRLLKRKSGDRVLRHATIIESDLRRVSSADFLEAAGARVAEIDLIAGGPPCQPFSRAGQRETVDCDTGRLFMEFVRVVRDLRPRWFLFENVKGLVITKARVARSVCEKCGARALIPFEAREDSLDGLCDVACVACRAPRTRAVWTTDVGGSLEIIISEFERAGYRCHFRVLNAADFGAPQIRERLFIVGSRDGEAFDWPQGTHADGGARQDATKLSSLSDARGKNWTSVRQVLWKKGHWRYGKLDLHEAVLWVKNVVRPHDEPVTWPLSRPAPTIGAHQGAKLALAPFSVPKAQLDRQQWHVLGRRQGDTPPVFVEHEYLTDSELLALQTFPPWWYLYGTRMERAFQIGNAVPPALAAAVGEALVRAMGLRPSPPGNSYTASSHRLRRR